MKKEYRLGEDIFLVLATLLIAFAVVLKLFDASLTLGLTAIYPSTFLNGAVACLLFNIALNIQELARK